MAQSGVLAESGTVPSTSYIENLFRDAPTDLRFSQVSIQRFVPTTGLIEHTGQVDFILPALKAPNVYMIQNLMMQATVKIVDENGKLPLKTDKVVPVNNMLPSLFESLQMSINDVIVSPSGTNYAYKDFIQTVLSYGSDSQGSLQCKGFFNDAPFYTNEILGNSTYTFKTQYFRTDRQANTDFKPEGATFIGKVYHDFGTAQKFLPPNTNVSFKFKMSSEKFYLLKLPDDAKNYRFIITEFCLYCPVGILSQRMCTDLYARWTKENIKYYYDRLVVKTIAVPKGKQDFLTENLFPDNENPSRIFFMFVESDAMVGSYSKSPFAFKRAWTFETSDSLLEQSVYEENVTLKSHINDMRLAFNNMVQVVMEMKNKKPSCQVSPEGSDEDFDLVTSEDDAASVASKTPRKRQTRLQSSKKARKTKQAKRSSLEEDGHASSSAAGPSCSTASPQNNFAPLQGPPLQGGLTLEELESMNRSKLKQIGPSDTASSHGAAMSAHGSLQTLKADTHKKVWITKCELELNGSPIDQLYSKCSESDAMQDFVRLQKTLNQFCTQITNGITYEQFLANTYVVAYDLTTSQQAGLAYNINTIRTGEK